jgi:hypothetical protein
VDSSYLGRLHPKMAIYGRKEDPFHFWRFSLLPFQSYWTWYDGKYDFYPMSYDNLGSVSQNVLKFYQQLTGEERRIPFIFDNFHFYRSRVIGLDLTENRIFTLCRMITWVVFLRMVWNFISRLPVKRGGSLSFLTLFTFAVPELLDLIWRKIWFLPYVIW